MLTGTNYPSKRCLEDRGRPVALRRVVRAFASSCCSSSRLSSSCSSSSHLSSSCSSSRLSCCCLSCCVSAAAAGGGHPVEGVVGAGEQVGHLLRLLEHLQLCVRLQRLLQHPRPVLQLPPRHAAAEGGRAAAAAAAVLEAAWRKQKAAVESLVLE